MTNNSGSNCVCRLKWLKTLYAHVQDRDFEGEIVTDVHNNTESFPYAVEYLVCPEVADVRHATLCIDQVQRAPSRVCDVGVIELLIWSHLLGRISATFQQPNGTVHKIPIPERWFHSKAIIESDKGSSGWPRMPSGPPVFSNFSLG